MEGNDLWRCRESEGCGFDIPVPAKDYFQSKKYLYNHLEAEFLNYRMDFALNPKG